MWIRTTDKLPEPFEDVLGYFVSSVNHETGWYDVVSYNVWKHDGVELGTSWEDGTGAMCMRPPTHWMPILPVTENERNT